METPATRWCASPRASVWDVVGSSACILVGVKLASLLAHRAPSVCSLSSHLHSSTLRLTLAPTLLHRTWQNNIAGLQFTSELQWPVNHQTAVINLAFFSTVSFQNMLRQPSTSFSMCEKSAPQLCASHSHQFYCTWQNNHQTAVINLAVISFHQPSTSFSLCEKLFENWLRLLIISRAINLVHTEDRSIGAVISSWSWISLRASCHFEGRAHNNSNLGRFWLLHGLARNHCWSLSLYPWKLIWTLLLRAAEKGNSS